MIVDSCLDPSTAEPWPLQYLETLDLNVCEAVKLVVVTHFHDDHIRGITRVAQQAAGARIACSAALARKDVFQFVLETQQVEGGLGSGLDELRSLLRLAASQGGVVWAKANLPLHPRPPGDRPLVVALSPSEDSVERSIEALVLAAAGQGTAPAVARRFRAPDGPNAASVASQINVDAGSMLLGGDLERTTNRETGWDAVLSYAMPSVAASLYKVPHHASEGAHHEGVWERMLDPETVGIVTPWAKGAGYLPTDRDLDRLRSVCRELYVTALPAIRRVRIDPSVDRLVKRLHGDHIQEFVGRGHVRARRCPGEAQWRIELAGDASRSPEGTY